VVSVTRELLEQCKKGRDELLLVERQLEMCGTEPHRRHLLEDRAAKLRTDIGAVEAFINTLGDSVLRQVVALRYVEGLPLEATAEAVGYSLSQVKRRLRTMRESLEERMELNRKGVRK
jgi:DNA-directed RNA polymerase specialized sigma24 family protein